jgi:hypothetical protein
LPRKRLATVFFGCGFGKQNRTIRRGSAYPFRQTIRHARWKERLEDHLELLRCYYNFVRPHRALKFGREVRTPAMQAGFAAGRLSFREIFYATIDFGVLQNVAFVFFYFVLLVNVDDSRPLWQRNNSGLRKHRSGLEFREIPH